MRKITFNDIDKLEDLIEHHAGEDADNVWKALVDFKSDIYVDYKGEDLTGLVSYIHLPLEYDMIIAMEWDDKFTLSQFRLLKDMIMNRQKEIRINSDPTNMSLNLWVVHNGGYWDGDNMVFPERK